MAHTVYFNYGITVEEKAASLLKEFNKEKALDIVETMEDYANEFDYQEWATYWGKVKKIIKKSKKCQQ